jgi:hypothetical protein
LRRSFFSPGIFGRTLSDWTGKGCIVVMSLAAAAMADRRRFTGRCRYFAGRARWPLPSSLTALDDRHRGCWLLLIAVAGGMMTQWAGQAGQTDETLPEKFRTSAYVLL